MVPFFQKLFDTTDFTPRWVCGNWETGHGWLHILSDLAIFGAYFAIPLAITFYISKKRGEVSYPRLFWLFSAFIFSCGTTHLVDAIIFYHPIYRVSGILKLITAVVSWMTVIALIRVLPQALELPGLKRANHLLAEQVSLHRKTSAELERSNRDLGEFTGAIRHELRDPICSALFMAELAKESSEKGDAETLGIQVDLLVETLRRVDSRVNELHERCLPPAPTSASIKANSPMGHSQLASN
jgi:two-component system, chemotaxis family, sensor kinase Cph1